MPAGQKYNYKHDYAEKSRNYSLHKIVTMSCWINIYRELKHMTRRF